jgi:hypothetical protein
LLSSSPSVVGLTLLSPNTSIGSGGAELYLRTTLDVFCLRSDASVAGGASSCFVGAAVVVEAWRESVSRWDVITCPLFKEEVAGVAWLPMERRMRLKEAALVDMDWTSLANSARQPICKKNDGKNDRMGFVAAGRSYPQAFTIKGKSELQLLDAHLPKRTVAGGSRRCMSG